MSEISNPSAWVARVAGAYAAAPPAVAAPVASPPASPTEPPPTAPVNGTSPASSVGPVTEPAPPADVPAGPGAPPAATSRKPEAPSTRRTISRSASRRAPAPRSRSGRHASSVALPSGGALSGRQPSRPARPLRQSPFRGRHPSPVTTKPRPESHRTPGTAPSKRTRKRPAPPVEPKRGPLTRETAVSGTTASSRDGAKPGGRGRPQRGPG